jgi:hypothetical protein
MYYHNNKAYIDIRLSCDDAMKVRGLHDDHTHLLRGYVIQDPLNKDILKVKVPMRKGQILCAMTGTKPLRTMLEGEYIDIKMTYCGTWNFGDFCGYAWKLNQVSLTTTDYP